MLMTAGGKAAHMLLLAASELEHNHRGCHLRSYSSWSNHMPVVSCSSLIFTATPVHAG
jgi:hypothetical protein